MKTELKNTIENLKVIIKTLSEEKGKLIKAAIGQGIAKLDNEDFNPMADSEHPSSHDLLWDETHNWTIREDLKKIDAHLDLLWKTDSLIRNLYTTEIMDLSFLTPLDQMAD